MYRASVDGAVAELRQEPSAEDHRSLKDAVALAVCHKFLVAPMRKHYRQIALRLPPH